MTHKQTHKLFGVRAVEKGWVTEEQVLRALRVQYRAKILLRRHLFLGEVLVLLGDLDQSQVRELCGETVELHEEAEDQHAGRFFGDVAVELGFCTGADVFEALNTQHFEDNTGERHRLIGEILFQAGILTEAQVEAVVERLVDRLQEAATEVL